jgi:hypothetical protein
MNCGVGGPYFDFMVSRERQAKQQPRGSGYIQEYMPMPVSKPRSENFYKKSQVQPSSFILQTLRHKHISISSSKMLYFDPLYFRKAWACQKKPKTLILCLIYQSPIATLQIQRNTRPHLLLERRRPGLNRRSKCVWSSPQGHVQFRVRRTYYNPITEPI